MSEGLLELNLAEEIARLWAGEAVRVGRASTTLVKRSDLRILLMVVKAGSRVAEHKASGSVSIHTLQGHMRVRVSREGQVELLDMPAGRVVVLDADVPHDVEAVADTAFLLTIAWPAGRGA